MLGASIEKSWASVPPQLFIEDGTAQGVVTVANSSGFKVKQQIVIVATGLPSLTVKIMRFISPTQFYVGPTNPTAGQGLTGRQDISAYTVAAGAYVYAETQPKVTIKPDDIWQAVYRQEPGTTIGVEIDDQWGNPINAENPLPVSIDGTISIGEVSIVEGGNTLAVNPDGSINVDATIENPIEVKGATGNILVVNPDGSINVSNSGIIELKGPSGNIVEVSPAKAANVNLIPVSQIPFSLGALALPSLINTLLSSLSYDSVSSDSTIGQEMLTFYDSGVAVTTITMIQTADGWTLTLGAPILDYLLLENGDYIELENGTGFILLEH